MRWLLIVALAIGLVGMHHLPSEAHAAGGHHPTTHASSHNPATPGAAHGCCGGELAMGHPCQAVLPSDGLPLVGAVAFAVLAAVSPTLALSGTPTAHPPRGPPSGAALLLRLCVSRR